MKQPYFTPISTLYGYETSLKTNNVFIPVSKADTNLRKWSGYRNLCRMFQSTTCPLQSVEAFCEFNKYHEDLNILFDVFLLPLSQGDNHVHDS